MRVDHRGFGMVEMLIVFVVIFAIYYYISGQAGGGKGKPPLGLASDVLTHPAANKETIDAVEKKMNRLTNQQSEKINKFVGSGEVDSQPVGK